MGCVWKGIGVEKIEQGWWQSFQQLRCATEKREPVKCAQRYGDGGYLAIFGLNENTEGVQRDPVRRDMYKRERDNWNDIVLWKTEWIGNLNTGAKVLGGPDLLLYLSARKGAEAIIVDIWSWNT